MTLPSHVSGAWLISFCFIVINLHSRQCQGFCTRSYSTLTTSLQFPFKPSKKQQQHRPFQTSRATSLNANNRRDDTKSNDEKSRREKIIHRDGDYFQINRIASNVELGYTTEFRTALENGNSLSISQWLSDDKSLALSLWDKDLITDLGDNVYRLSLLSLKFLTVELTPQVDVIMRTVQSEEGNPTFTLESIAFDPNVKIFPGLSVTSETMGITIDVVGELGIAPGGKGLVGRLGFLTCGKLLPVMRLVPEPVMKKASALLNRQVANFAMKSFQKGGVQNYKEFVRAEQKMLR